MIICSNGNHGSISYIDNYIVSVSLEFTGGTCDEIIKWISGTGSGYWKESNVWWHLEKYENTHGMYDAARQSIYWYVVWYCHDALSHESMIRNLLTPAFAISDHVYVPFATLFQTIKGEYLLFQSGCNSILHRTVMPTQPDNLSDNFLT
jgi:hypothetical protein